VFTEAISAGPTKARAFTGRAFALFYTGVIGAGGLAPIAYGAIADHYSRMAGISAAALTAVAIIPLILALRPSLEASSACG
jgi:FSR family fosmidomycin resistance protein-like MFS transporter